MPYPRVLQIVQNEDYLSAADRDVIRIKKRVSFPLLESVRVHIENLMTSDI